MSAARNDPTASGFAPPPAGLARLSENEVETLCLKAARGAGMDWGMAEEAGFAVRWLVARGIDGAAALRAHLDLCAGRDWHALRPAGLDRLRPKGAPALCPIALGTALSDLGRLPEGPAGPVRAPILLLAFLHPLARAHGAPVALGWAGGSVTVGPEGGVAGDLDALAVSEATSVTFSRGQAAPPPQAPAERLAIGRQTLARLNAYALRTTVPATGASRSDAGAAQGDND